MKTAFTYTEMQQSQGCYEREPGKLDALMQGAQQVTLGDILAWNIPAKDKAWFFCHSCELTQAELVSFATKCARIVLHIFEDEYPNDHCIRLAIEAAERWITEPSPGNTSTAARVARDAIYATHAAIRTTRVTTRADAVADAYAAHAYAAEAAAAATCATTDADAFILEIMEEMLRSNNQTRQ